MLKVILIFKRLNKVEEINLSDDDDVATSAEGKVEALRQLTEERKH